MKIKNCNSIDNVNRKIRKKSKSKPTKNGAKNDFNVKKNCRLSPSLSEKRVTRKKNKRKRNELDIVTTEENITLISDNNSTIRKEVIDNSMSFINTIDLLLNSENDKVVDSFNFSGNVSSVFENCSDDMLNSSASNDDLFNIEPNKRPTFEDVNTNCLESLDVQNGQIVILKENANLCIHGAAELTVLKGCVEVLGTIINIHSACEIYSPRGASFLCITGKTCKNKAKPIIPEGLNVSRIQMNKALEKLTDDDALILCKLIQSDLIKSLEKYVPQQLLPSNPNKFNLLNKISDINFINIPQSWFELSGCIKEDSRVLICGGKGVGKSTLLRYLVNKLVMQYNEILVIDLDPGQSEFTIPGCVSSTVITKPLLGPNYTHLQKPEKSFFIPNISVLHSPIEYIIAIQELLKTYKHFNKYPTIINYMGFSRSLGCELLSSVIGICNPSLIFQINSKNRTKNLDVNFDLCSLQENAQFFTPQLQLSTNFEVHKVESPSDNCTGWECGPRQLREMCIISYFSEILNKNTSIYMISLSSINIITPTSATNPYVVANANLVALCSKTSKRTTLYECHGWGIVRAIDLVKEILYLMTPLNENDLKNVKYLIVGSVKMPAALYMNDENTGAIPYVSYGFETPFSQIPKRAYIPKSK